MINLPDELVALVDARVEEYLRDNPGMTLSALVQEALDEHLEPPDLQPLLDLAGIVKSAPVHAADNAEDYLIRPDTENCRRLSDA